MEAIARELKGLVGKVPHPVLLGAYWATYGAALDLRGTATRHAARLPPLSRLDLHAFKRSETLFILGSGSSINAIDDERWRSIRENDSIGFNFWLRHPHVPTMYMCECIDVRSAPRAAMHWVRLAHERARDYSGVPIIVTDLQPSRLDMIRMVPEEWRPALHALVTVPLFARSAGELRTALAILESAGAFSRARHVHRVLKYRASVVALVTLGVRLGYRRIVLCGIDLKDPAYFYEDASRYPDMATFRSSPATSVHTTLIPRPMLLPVDVIISEMRDQVLTPRGVEIFVQSPTSALYPRIPVAPESVYR